MARFNRFVALVLGVFLSIGTLCVAPIPAAAADCQFVLGFKAIHDMIPNVVGNCLVNEHHNPVNGDGLQETTGPTGKGGLLVWRKADNWTAYTDGYHTWVNGPNGLQERLNTQRFPWEGDYATFSHQSTPTPVPSASVPQSGIAFVGNPTVLKDSIATLVIGQLQNVTSGPLSGTVTATFFDGSGNITATANGAFNDVQPNQTKVYMLIATKDPGNYAKVVPQINVTLNGKVLPALAISHVAVQSDAIGQLVVGQVTNDDTSAHSFTIVAGFFDANGQLVGVASGAVNNLAAGSAQTFQLLPAGPIPGYKNVTVQVDTLAE